MIYLKIYIAPVHFNGKFILGFSRQDRSFMTFVVFCILLVYHKKERVISVGQTICYDDRSVTSREIVHATSFIV